MRAQSGRRRQTRASQPRCLRALSIAAAVTLGLSGACAASPPPPAASLDEAFAAIQVHEARIEHARASVRSATSECAAVCAGAADAGRSARELCAIARKAADPDALTRCEGATRSAATIHLQAVQRCGCAERVP